MQKQREESIQLYTKGNRIDLVQSEEDEIKIIKQFLPKQLDDDEIIKIVKEAINKKYLDNFFTLFKKLSNK